jgi:hypothetical protein
MSPRYPWSQAKITGYMKALGGSKRAGSRLRVAGSKVGNAISFLVSKNLLVL